MKDFTSLQFEDVASMIRGFYESRKRTDPAWSYERWVRSLGLRNNSTLIKVARGQRKAGEKLARALEEYFGWSDHERQYFRVICALEQARLPIDDELRRAVCVCVRAHIAAPKAGV